MCALLPPLFILQLVCVLTVLAFIKKLTDMDVKTIVFDMDYTACTRHSGGILPRSDVEDYIKCISPDFKRLIPHLFKAEFNIVIASFTDDQYYCKSMPQEQFICGHDLIKAFLSEHFPVEIVEKIFTCPFYPALHPELQLKNNKNYHLNKVCDKFKVERSTCVLFDDTKPNVRAADGFKAFPVDRTVGFCLTDLK